MVQRIRVLIVTWMSIEVMVHSSFTGFHIKPSHQDLELVDNMTDWVLDAEVELYLKAHLLLCPEQDMCFGDTFRRNYTFTLSTHSCGHCNCDSQCHRKRNCCPWRSYNQEKDTSPDFISFREHSDLLQKNNKTCSSPLRCVTPQIVKRNIFPLRSIKSYLMVAQCCVNADAETKRRCENNTDFHDINLYHPVFSLSSNETYKNQDCALCNGEAISNLMPWTTTLVCSSKDVLFKTYSYDLLHSVMFQMNSSCNVVFVPPENIKTYRCFQKEMYVAFCGPDHWTSFNSIIYKACLSDYVNYYLLCRSPFEMTLYKNVFCAMCNTANWKLDLTIECDASNIDMRNIGTTVVFSAVIDPPKNGQHHQHEEESRCPSNALYDEELNKCSPILCGDGMEYRNAECTPVFSFILQNNYEINLVFYPVSNYTFSRRESTIGINSFLLTFARDSGIYEYICFYDIYYYPDEELWSKSNFYFVAVIIISIDYWHNYKDFIQRLNEVLATVQNKVVSGLSLRHIGQSLRALRKLGTQLIEGIQNPMNNDILIYQSSFYGTRTAQNSACYARSAMERVSVVAERSVCPKFQFDTREVHVTISNFSVCFVKLDFCVDSLYYQLSRDKSKVEVCVQKYIESKHSRSSMPESIDEGILASLVCNTLSSAGCGAFLISNFIIHRGRSHSVITCNIIIASSFLFLANTAYTLSKIFQQGIFGQVLYGFSRLCWLTVTIFMFNSCLTTYCLTMMRSNKIPTRNVCHNMCLSLLISGVLVFVGELLNHVNYPHLSLTLFTFTIPILLLAILNLLVFFFSIRKTKKVSSVCNYEWQMVTTFCKMSIIAAYSWLFNYMHQVYRSQVYLSLHLFFIAIMGLFLFFAFGSTSTSKTNKCVCEKTQLSARKD